MTTAAALLTVLGFLIVAIGAWCGFWIWLDAREAAIDRKHEAEMADALARDLQRSRADRGYLTNDPNRPE